MSPAAVIPVCPVDQIATVPSTVSPAPRSSSAMLDEVIGRHWRSLEASHKPSAWGALDRGYREAHRAYHAWELSRNCWRSWTRFRRWPPGRR